MKATLTLLLALSAASPLLPQPAPKDSSPQFASDGKLILPSNYREWVFLSSGLGMTYDPTPTPNSSPKFNNVFVTREAYRSFLKFGKWPDKTVLILEICSASSVGSINTGGYYQDGVLAVEAEVKDTARFPESGWAFFAFGKATSGSMLPRTATCYSCHRTSGAVDNTFVQFYPALLAIAKDKGTLSPAYLAAPKHDH